MAIVRTILWVLILVALLLFSWANWQPGISVRIWSNLVVDTRLPAVVVVAFLLGLIPMWLFHRGVAWRLNRRIRHLEIAVQPTAASPTRVEPADTALGGSATPAGAPSEPQEDHRPLRPSDPQDSGIRP
jgi:hypothetical protein